MRSVKHSLRAEDLPLWSQRAVASSTYRRRGDRIEMLFAAVRWSLLAHCEQSNSAVEHRRMHNSDYYREEAARYRELAEMAKDAAMKK